MGNGNERKKERKSKICKRKKERKKKERKKYTNKKEEKNAGRYLKLIRIKIITSWIH